MPSSSATVRVAVLEGWPWLTRPARPGLAGCLLATRRAAFTVQRLARLDAQHIAADDGLSHVAPAPATPRKARLMDVQ
jgi:hypothetical protein